MNGGPLAELLAELDAELSDFDVGALVAKQMVEGPATTSPPERQGGTQA